MILRFLAKWVLLVNVFYCLLTPGIEKFLSKPIEAYVYNSAMISRISISVAVTAALLLLWFYLRVFFEAAGPSPMMITMGLNILALAAMSGGIAIYLQNRLAIQAAYSICALAAVAIMIQYLQSTGSDSRQKAISTAATTNPQTLLQNAETVLNCENGDKFLLVRKGQSLLIYSIFPNQDQPALHCSSAGQERNCPSVDAYLQRNPKGCKNSDYPDLKALVQKLSTKQS